MSESQPETVGRMVAEARERVENLSVERAAAEIEGGEVLLIDVREDEERLLEGAIVGSVHVPRGMLELSADPASPLLPEGVRSRPPDRPLLLLGEPLGAGGVYPPADGLRERRPP